MDLRTHIPRYLNEMLQEMFSDRLVYLSEAIQWPPSSPDLSPCDFFPQEVPPYRSFKHRLRFLDQLKMAVQEEIVVNFPEILMRTMKNFKNQ